MARNDYGHRRSSMSQLRASAYHYTVGGYIYCDWFSHSKKRDCLKYQAPQYCFTEPEALSPCRRWRVYRGKWPHLSGTPKRSASFNTLSSRRSRGQPWDLGLVRRPSRICLIGTDPPIYMSRPLKQTCLDHISNQRLSRELPDLFIQVTLAFRHQFTSWRKRRLTG